MLSSYQIDEIKSSLVFVSAFVFSLLKNEWKFEEDWLTEDDKMENLMISTWENVQLVKG